jgi:diacylglycerol kinase family enzyme
VYGFRPTRWQLLRVLLRTMRPSAGNYVELDGINEVHTTWLRVHTERPTPAHADGEVFSTAIQDLEYHVLPAHLQILMGTVRSSIDLR